jgi:hypothetical protein
MNGRISALKRAADWIQLSELVETAIELQDRCSLPAGSHSDLELLKSEILWRTESDLSVSLDRSLACADDESATTTHRAEAALLAAIVADTMCRFADLERLNRIALVLSSTSVGSRTNLLAVRLIYETISGSLERATECAMALVELERELGSVRGLARALRYSCLPSRMNGSSELALAAATEALELAEHHGLVGDAAAAADIIVSIHLERQDADAAAIWIPRCESVASRVGARYALASLAINRAIHAHLTGDAESAMRYAGPDISKHFLDPAIRQRMLYLSVHARVLVAHADRNGLLEIAPMLAAALQLRRSTGAHDFHVASYAFALRALGESRAARDYVADFVALGRRDRTNPSDELQRILAQ